MAASAGAGPNQRWHAVGLEPLPPSRGVNALGRLLAEDATQAIVLPISWRQFAETVGPEGIPPFLSDVAGRPRPGARIEAAGGDGSELKKELAQKAPREREELVRGRLAREAATVLGFSSDHVLDSRRPLNEIGLDSLMALQLRTALERIVGRPLPATLLFNYPTLDALTRFLLTELLPRDEAPQARSAPRAADGGGHREAIAIVGMACRFPGGADDPIAFWENLRDGVDAVTEVPPSLGTRTPSTIPTPKRRGKMNTRSAGFLGHVEQIRRAVFRDFAARSDPHGSAAAPAARGELGGAGAGGQCT